MAGNDKMMRRRSPRGFTLVEMVITMAILAIMTALATPSFVDFMRSAELTATANRMVNALATARSEALKRNGYVYVIPLSGTDWTSGWHVFADTDMDGAYDEDEDISLLKTDALSTDYLTASMTHSYVIYNGSGFSINANGSFGARSMIISRTDVTCSASAIRLIIISSTGRVRVCTPSSSSVSSSSCTASILNADGWSDSDCASS